MIKFLKQIMKTYTCGQCGRTFNNALAFLTHLCNKPEEDDNG